MNLYLNLTKQLEQATETTQKQQILTKITENFPQCYGFQIQLINISNDKLEAIQQALQATPFCTQLWKFYLTYAATSSDLLPHLSPLHGAALDLVGSEPSSLELWQKYDEISHEDAQKLFEQEPRALPESEIFVSKINISSPGIIKILDAARQFFHPKQLKPNELIAMEKAVRLALSFPEPLRYKVLKKLELSYAHSQDFWWIVLGSQYEGFIDSCKQQSRVWSELEIVVKTFEGIKNGEKLDIMGFVDLRQAYYLCKSLEKRKLVSELQEVIQHVEQTCQFKNSLEQSFYVFKSKIITEWTSQAVYNDYQLYKTTWILTNGCKKLNQEQIYQLGRKILSDGDEERGLWIISQQAQQQ